MAHPTRADAIVRRRPAHPGLYVEWPTATVPRIGGVLHLDLGAYVTTGFGGREHRRGVEHTIVYVDHADRLTA